MKIAVSPAPEVSPQNVTRDLNLDILKIFACFIVIVFHVGYSLQFVSVKTFILIWGLTKPAVALFILTTGALLIGRQDTWRKTAQRIFRVAVPLVLLNLLYWLKAAWPNISLGGLWQFIKAFCAGTRSETFHLWYLYVLIGLYLIMPVLQKAARAMTEKDNIVFVSVFLVLPSVMPFLIHYLNIKVSETIFQLTAYAAYLPAGFWLARKKFSFRARLILLGVYAVSVICNYFLLYSVFKSGAFPGDFDTITHLPMLASSLTLFILFNAIPTARLVQTKAAKWITEISKTTFGVYLIHVFLYRYMQKRFESIGFLNGRLRIAALIVLTFVIGVPVIWLLRKVPVVKKFL